ncbi:hypothetical protein [Lysinibacillus sphaericus]|uniref:VOC domain-containing protein n=1 Tax=Lysinibacillus sphaericus OT4b.31 TaxID=1285586 RepID=R7Z8L2_LYSSH|nr:hypothetical protein [Lysinibacillus sphaericus]EON70364.1 hypothetical protein H131_21672 [Lysinibacillus sphaericus OT4b.31]
MKITKVKLYAYDLPKLKEFYCEKLGLALLTSNDSFFEIAVGESMITFERISTSVNKQYHFAFNIPSNLFVQAKNWVKGRVDILQLDQQDEVYFERIKAHSFYFYDPEENVVELIARSEVNPHSDTDAFLPAHLLNIGEINLTTDSIHEVATYLIEHGILPCYGEEVHIDALTFMGNYEDGTNILLGPSKRNWYFSNKDAIVSPISIELNHTLQLNMKKDGEFMIVKL